MKIRSIFAGVFYAAVVLMPWRIKRRVLSCCFGFDLHPRARIGLSWIFPKRLVMAEGSRIDHFTVAIHLDQIEMGDHSSIGRSNWITGFRSGTSSVHFSHQPGRRSRLVMGRHSAITKNHHLDCTSPIEIGCFTTVAGYYSQLLTHSIDVEANRQHSEPIRIGDYCFVGTKVVLLGSAELPSYSVLAAKSLLNKRHTEEWSLYAGVPAQKKADIPKSAKYFSRVTGFVD